MTMNFLSISTSLNDQADVIVEFDWFGEEPSWDTMEVWALLPTQLPEEKRLVKINDLLSDNDWVKIERDIYEREDDIRRQAEIYYC